MSGSSVYHIHDNPSWDYKHEHGCDRESACSCTAALARQVAAEARVDAPESGCAASWHPRADQKSEDAAGARRGDDMLATES